jgi:preprotein translocase subunit SecE
MADQVAPRGTGTQVAERKSVFVRLNEFYHEVIAEMRKVTWPDQAQLRDTTIKMLIFVLFVAAVIGLLDVIIQMIFVRGLPSLFTR